MDGPYLFYSVSHMYSSSGSYELKAVYDGSGIYTGATTSKNINVAFSQAEFPLIVVGMVAIGGVLYYLCKKK